MLTILVPAGWILFDVLICLRTGYMTKPFPGWEWWTWLVSGLVLAGLSMYGQWRESKKHEREMATLKVGQTQHSQEHEILAGAALKTLETGSNLALLVQRLENVTNTHGAPIVTTIEMATETIQTLQAEVTDLSTMFWRSPNEAEANKLEYALREIGIHSARFNSHENTDCSRLARNLAAIFVLAEWEVSGPHTGTFDTSGTSGILVRGKDTLELASQVSDAIRLTINVNCGATIGLKPELPWDLVITIGPKGTVRSQLSRAEREN